MSSHISGLVFFTRERYVHECVLQITSKMISLRIHETLSDMIFKEIHQNDFGTCSIFERFLTISGYFSSNTRENDSALD